MSPMNNRLLVPRKTPGLLDLVPGAAAAYSLRSLSNSYAGPVVTVRRSSDDAEDSFTAAEVADGTLAAFCGAGDGFVKTWHSQTGGNDATQTTAGYQPKIVSSGVVILEGGKPAIQFDGAGDYLEVPSSTGSFNFLHNGTKSAIFSLLAGGNTGTFGAFVGNDGGSSAKVGAHLAFDDRTGSGYYDSLSAGIFRGVSGTYVVGTNINYFFTKSTQQISAVLLDAAAATASSRCLPFANGVEYASGNVYTASPSSANATHNMQIGGIGGGVGSFLGTMQELLIYPSDQTANRELLEGQIAWSYSQ